MNNSNENPSQKKPENSAETKSTRQPDKKKSAGRAGGNAQMNRVLYITAVVLLVSLAVIAAVVAASNRAKKNPVPTPSPDVSTKLPANSHWNIPTPSAVNSDPTPTNTKTPEPSSTTPSTNVSGKLPSFSLPASGNLSGKHDPALQVFSPTMKDYRVHLGIDINTAAGAPVYAAADGKVEKVWEDPLMGWCIAVSHDGKAVSYYKNLSKTIASGIKAGTEVRSGQLLGSVGDSAMVEVAQEPHLHFEMTVGGLQVNPLDYFSAADLESSKPIPDLKVKLPKAEKGTAKARDLP